MTILDTAEVRLDDAGPSVLSRALRVLGAFDERHPCWSLADLARTLEMPKSTVHRVLQELVAGGMLRRVETNYVVSLRLLQIGSASAHARLCELAAPHLRRLRDLTGQTVHLAVLDGVHLFYLDKLPGAHSVPMPSRRGGHQLAACTAAGKALLASSDRPTRERAVRAGLPAFTKNTLVDPQRLRAELERTAQRRFAVDNQEVRMGLVCVAVAITGPDGRPVAAVSISGNAQQIEPDNTSDVLLMTRRAIAQSLPADLARQAQPA